MLHRMVSPGNSKTMGKKGQERKKPRKRTIRSRKITCNSADRTARRVNGAMKWRMGAVICRIARRSCFCPHLHPSVKIRRQDHVCFPVIWYGVWLRHKSIMPAPQFFTDRFMRHRSASLAKSRPTIKLGRAIPERFLQEKLPQGIFRRKTRRA